MRTLRYVTIFLLSFALTPVQTLAQSRVRQITGKGIVGGMLGAVIGAVANPNDRGSGAWRGAAVGGGIGAVMGAVQNRGQNQNSGNKNRRAASAVQAPAGQVPSLTGHLVAIRFDQGNYYETGQFLESFVFQEFAKLGATPIRQAPNTWGNPCELPGRKVVCVSVGPAAQLASNGGSSNVGIWGRNPMSTSGSNWDQLYVVGVHIDLYDNPAASTNSGWNQRTQPVLTTLATANGAGNARSGSSFVSMQISNMNVSTNSNSWAQPQLAALDAAGRAISKLLRGEGWMPYAEAVLR